MTWLTSLARPVNKVLCMKTHHLICHSRSRSHAYGMIITRRYRDLLDSDETRSTVDFCLVRASHRFDGERGVPFHLYARVWIRRELMNLLQRRLVERQRHSKVLHPPAGGTNQQPDKHLLVDQLLKKLDEEERKLVVEHILEGQSLSALARRKGRHRAWACRLLKRALGHLRLVVEAPDSLENARPRVGRLIHHAITDAKVTP
jgi:RNA polymerase sigma factor (sigma-70 family)